MFDLCVKGFCVGEGSVGDFSRDGGEMLHNGRSGRDEIPMHIYMHSDLLNLQRSIMTNT